MNQDLLNLLKQRRSIYALGKDIKQNPDELVALIESVIQETPTAFNSQATRAVFLFGEQHDKLWDIVVKRLKSEVPSEEAYEATKKKIAGFKAAFATILYFTDTDVVKQLEKNFPLYADNFATWAEQSQGSAQLNTWVSVLTCSITTRSLTTLSAKLLISRQTGSYVLRCHSVPSKAKRMPRITWIVSNNSKCLNNQL